jgi:hypothetical protein
MSEHKAPPKRQVCNEHVVMKQEHMKKKNNSGSITSNSTTSVDNNNDQEDPENKPQHGIKLQEEQGLRQSEELEEFKMPAFQQNVSAKKEELIPDTIMITNREGNNDDLDNCSLISGLTLTQESIHLKNNESTHHHQKKYKSKKAKNKVDPTSSRRGQRRPTTDAGDCQPDRAQDMTIKIIMNGKLVTGTYSGSLTKTAPRKPNGAGVIKFDNGDMVRYFLF